MWQTLQRPTGALALLAAASLGALAVALVFQYGLGLPPCPFCHYQRWPYIAVAAVAILALAAGRGRPAALGLSAALLLLDAGLAGFHVGMEQGWWQGPASCTGAALTGSSVADLKAQLMAAPAVRCDEAPWSLAGISIAGYNFIAAMLLTLFAAAALLRSRRAAR